MYKNSLGKSIVCAWWAEPKKEMACEPSFGNVDADLWVRAEVVDAHDRHIADIEIFGTPRVMQNVTLYYKNGKYELQRGAPIS